MTQALRARLSGPATRFVMLLRDFGHIDDRGVDELIAAASEIAVGEEEIIVDLPTMRRLAAVYLFESHPDGIDGLELLSEDWGMLFH